MFKEELKGKPEQIGKIAPTNSGGAVAKVSPASTQELMSSANRAVENYTAQGAVARHPLGRGLPADHPALN
jgi:hypothetical protein